MLQDESLIQDNELIIEFDKPVKEINTRLKWVKTQQKKELLPKIFAFSTHKRVSVRQTLVDTLSIFAGNLDEVWLLEWKNRESESTISISLEALIDKNRRVLAGEIEDSEQVYSVGEAILYVKKTISGKEFLIEAEIGQVQVYGYNKIYYITLKENEDTSIQAMMPEVVAYKLGVSLNEGLLVRVKGSFTLSKNGSRLTFVITSIRLSGEGELARNLKLLEEKLAMEGLFDESRKRSIPVLPRRVLLLASSASAALTDYQKVLQSRRGGMTIFHLPVKTQGVGAERDLIITLEGLNTIIRENTIELVVMTRGGGSKEDLQIFNSERVVRLIHGIEKPTIVAIGHERDTTLSELVADLRCSTPSQAAEKSGLSNQEVLLTSQNQLSKIVQLLTGKLTQYTITTESIMRNMIRFLSKFTSESNRLYLASVQSVATAINDKQNLIQLQFSKMVFTLQKKVSECRNTSLVLVSSILQHDISQIYKKGFVRLQKRGRSVSSVNELITGDTIELELQDGTVESTITKAVLTTGISL
jgi:exodeoxyribonuclease VII large subunit